MTSTQQKETNTPIGIFDSGIGGLTILKEIRKLLPQYDYIYLGDNARTPYGTRSFDVVYEYTLEAVKKLFEFGCELVILACNTASAKALRTIQQNDLPHIAPQKRVLGVIRPSTETVVSITKNNHVGILGTNGTVSSNSYVIELEKISKGELIISQEACPMWVPIVENNEIGTMGANYFIEKNITNLFNADPEIDTIILGCTHYPLLIPSIGKYIPGNVTLVDQGPIVAEK
ncbi:MAG: glutamate racemase, partial [Prolixibacteraceae bacterium]|nr:glutamate racemase [Prolixibacteraceae bacterium]